MEVRKAERGDLLGVARVVHAACWETFTGLLKPQTIAEGIATIYTPSALKRWLLAGELYVGVDESRVVQGFAVVATHPDHADVFAIAVDPSVRHKGLARRLIERMREDAGGLPMCLTVLLGSLDGEHFAESLGMVPGEIIERDFCGEDIVERRWWLPTG